MIEVEMNRDVREFEPKIISAFTARQLFCLGIGVAYSAPIALLLPFGPIVKVFVAVILMAPAIMCGWVKIFDFYLDQFVTEVFLPNLLTPSIRRYETKNAYESLLEPEVKASGNSSKQKIKYTRDCRPRR